jgi:hypothetical protein
MIIGLIAIYILLKVRSNQKIKRIKNPTRIIGEVSGYEIKVDSKKKWTYDVVSFYIDGEMFTAKKTSSPFYLSSHSKIGVNYEIIYDKNCPSDNIIIDNSVFEQIKKSILVLSSTYIIALIAFMLMK